jgi:hypothetical protein
MTLALETVSGGGVRITITKSVCLVHSVPVEMGTTQGKRQNFSFAVSNLKH